MLKMREKVEILKECGFGTLKGVSDSTIRYCQIEVAIDIRNVLESIFKESEETNRLERLRQGITE